MNQVNAEFHELQQEVQSSINYAFQMAVKGFTFEISKRMEIQNLRHQDLAERLDVSRSYVTQLLSGKSNFTLETMVKVAKEVGCKLTIQFDDIAESCAQPNFMIVGKAEGSTTVSVSKSEDREDLWHNLGTRSRPPQRGSSLVSLGGSRFNVTGEGLLLPQTPCWN